MSNRLIKLCPACGHHNDPAEFSCVGLVKDGSVCGYSLWDVVEGVADFEGTPSPPSPPPPAPPPAPTERLCINGHVLAVSDQICLVCGAGPLAAEQPEPTLPPPAPPCESLEDLIRTSQLHPALLRGLLERLTTALHQLHLQGNSYGDLRPDLVRILSRAPLEVELVTSIEAGKPADVGDLSTHITTQVGLYTPPERLIGMEAPRSDWWSLGLLMLYGHVGPNFWAGVHERAWQLQVITDGVVLPETITEPWSTLLSGLLTQDPQERWGHEEVIRWLDGDDDIPFESGKRPQVQEGTSIRIAGERHRSPARYALAAAQKEAWEEALAQLQQGELLTWLEENGTSEGTLAEVRRLAEDETLELDERLMLVLVLLNPNLPLCIRGEVIGAGTITVNPQRARNWLDGVLPVRLRRIERQLWLADLAERRTSTLELAKTLQINLEEPRFEAASLINDRRRLENAWAVRRKDWPVALHNGLANLISRSRLSDQHLILLHSAELSQFRSAADVLQEAKRLAMSAGVAAHWDENVARQWLARSQREFILALQERLADFVQCGLPDPDAWADAFRSDQRIPPEQALVLLAIPADRWERPAGGEHWQRLLQFFRRRVLWGIQRGPLLALSVSARGKRIDLSDLISETLPADTLINHLVGRQTRPRSLDPRILEQNPTLNQRLRRLRQEAEAYQRETGISALYLGYPLLLRRNNTGNSGPSRKPALLPLLLWPVRLGLTGHGTLPQLSYDKDRSGSDGIRLNPALEGVIPSRQIQALQEALEELGQRSALTGIQVMDVMRTIFAAREGVLEPCHQNLALPDGCDEQLLPSGILFLCSFSAQTLAHELEQLERRPCLDGPMAALLRLTASAIPTLPKSDDLPEEYNRYLVTPADPSQKRAVWASRNKPGVLIQGPPGTGKSQTIVNIVADALGRGELVLVVCQKQAALEVVQNRLEAVGLGGRCCLITEPSGDRRNLLRKLRDDLDFWDPSRRREHLTRERLAIAAEISRLEQELDALHQALAKPVSSSGLDHRQVIDELLQLNAPAHAPSLVALRPILQECHIEEVRTISRQCADIAGLWLKARPENSPLQVLLPFPTDESTISAFTQAFRKFRDIDSDRVKHLSDSPHILEGAEPDLVEVWVNDFAPLLETVDSSLLNLSVKWMPLFADQTGNIIINNLSSLEAEAESILIPGSFVKWQSRLDRLTDKQIEQILSSLDRIVNNQTLLASRISIQAYASISPSDIDRELVAILKDEETRANSMHYLSSMQKWLDENKTVLLSIDEQILTLITRQKSFDLSHWKKILSELVTIRDSLGDSLSSDLGEWRVSSCNLADSEIAALIEAAQTRKQWMHSMTRFLRPHYLESKLLLKKTFPNVLLKKEDNLVLSLEQSLRNEIKRRTLQSQFLSFAQRTGIEANSVNTSWSKLHEKIVSLVSRFDIIISLVNAVSSSPSRNDVEDTLLSGDMENVSHMINATEIASKIAELCSNGNQIVKRLSHFCKDEWCLFVEKKINDGQSISMDIAELHRASYFSTSAYLEVQKAIPEFVVDQGLDVITPLAHALAHVTRVRNYWIRFDSILNDLGLSPSRSETRSLQELLAKVAHLRNQLNICRSLLQSVNACPLRREAHAALKSGIPEFLASLLRQLAGGVKRQILRQECHKSLSALSPWCTPDWIETLVQRINKDELIVQDLARIEEELPRLIAFQGYRSRSSSLSASEQAVMVVLATVRNHWEDLEQDQLPEFIRITIEREALLGWQAEAEAREPALLLSREEMQSRTLRLQDLDNRFLTLNRTLTAIPVAPERVQPRSSWDDIVMLQGPRARKMREIVELGEERGLFELCPVWLANPETVSQIFPLRQKFFDLVIFDEASQLPVENALPAIFRASRLVVSGDEKQLPPTRFFSSGFADDGEEDINRDEDGEEVELLADIYASSESRRQVKDCTDLLELAGAAGLSHVSLDIHYRSRFRPLIAHSNAAFYQNKLSIPVLHPADEIRRSRPLHLEMINGVYERQSNRKEAEAVTDYLQKLWCRPRDMEGAALPTLGVVTFNKTQAELIEDELDRRAKKDDSFQEILERERQRRNNGEDCGFFVKNLENVQGDERDIILFSTTFGRDSSDRFRRFFGALGQKGGERRLNVATSRARDKVVIFCSMPIEEISDAHRHRQSPQQSRDFLQSYLLYAAAISAGRLDEAEKLLQRIHTPSSARKTVASTRTERYFIRNVEHFLHQLNLEVERPTTSDAFSFDLAVRDPRTGLFTLGIECDSPRHDDLSHARDREIWRPRVLKSTLPHVHRVWSRLWLSEPEREQQRLRSAVFQALPSLSKEP